MTSKLTVDKRAAHMTAREHLRIAVANLAEASLALCTAGAYAASDAIDVIVADVTAEVALQDAVLRTDSAVKEI